jgi:hypothetical protein
VVSALTALTTTQTIPRLIFGVIYFAIGVLLSFTLRVSMYLGIIFPLIGLVAGFAIIGFQNWTRMLRLLYAIDVVVIIGSLLFQRSRPIDCQRTKRDPPDSRQGLWGTCLSREARNEWRSSVPDESNFGE